MRDCKRCRVNVRVNMLGRDKLSDFTRSEELCLLMFDG